MGARDLTPQDAAALAGPRPVWKRNIGGVRGAVGYYDSAGGVVVVVNWESLVFQRRARIDVSAPGYGMELLEEQGSTGL